MKQYKVDAHMFNRAGSASAVPDAYVDPAVLRAHGIASTAPTCDTTGPTLPNLGKYQTDHNIKSGTPAWFKLWFSRPDLTGEKPY